MFTSYSILFDVSKHRIFKVLIDYYNYVVPVISTL